MSSEESSIPTNLQRCEENTSNSPFVASSDYTELMEVLNTIAE
jgi:hypothetical protein